MRTHEEALKYQRDYNKKNHEARRLYEGRYRKKLKLWAFEHYGRVCQCCGEPNPVFLAIDHIVGGGKLHRKSIQAGSKFYRWLRRNGYPFGYQVLCFNCNWGKHLQGICPHKSLDKVV